MAYEVLEDTPYGGKIYILTEPSDLESLPVAGQKLLTAYQLQQFDGFPGSLSELAGTTRLPDLSHWLNALAQAKECRLEVCLTEYADPIVFLRYILTDNVEPSLEFSVNSRIDFQDTLCFERSVRCDRPSELRWVWLCRWFTLSTGQIPGSGILS